MTNEWQEGTVGPMTISTDGFRIPVTLQLDARTYRAIHAAAKRASVVAEREVTMRELIEDRLAAAVTGVRVPDAEQPVSVKPTVIDKKNRGHRLTPEARALLVEMNAAGATAPAIAEAVGCHAATVAYYRRKFRREQGKEEANV